MTPGKPVMTGCPGAKISLAARALLDSAVNERKAARAAVAKVVRVDDTQSEVMFAPALFAPVRSAAETDPAGEVAITYA
jgi:hypothetical protein